MYIILDYPLMLELNVLNVHVVIVNIYDHHYHRYQLSREKKNKEFEFELNKIQKMIIPLLIYFDHHHLNLEEKKNFFYFKNNNRINIYSTNLLFQDQLNLNHNFFAYQEKLVMFEL